MITMCRGAMIKALKSLCVWRYRIKTAKSTAGKAKTFLTVYGMRVIYRGDEKFVAEQTKKITNYGR